MPHHTSPPESDNAAKLVRQLESTLAEAGPRLVPMADNWWRTVRRYQPLLEDLLTRTRGAREPEEVAFLAAQAEALLELRALDLEHALENQETAGGGALMLQLPLEPLQRRCERLAQCLASAECRGELSAVLGVSAAPARISVHDLLLRGVGRVLLRGWGSREILSAPIPARGRPSWDLFAPDLRIVAGARPRIQPASLVNLAPHRLIVSLPAQRLRSYVEVHLYSDLTESQPMLWTGLRWDEEQRLRAGSSARRQLPVSATGHALLRALGGLDHRLVELIAERPPTAPWPWRSRRVR